MELVSIYILCYNYFKIGDNMKQVNSGAEFLNLMYKDMRDSINSISNNPIDRINEYLDKLERVHSKADTKYKMDLLKGFYHDKYVIKFLPESYIEYRKGYFRELGLDEKEDLTDEDKSLVLGAIRNEQKISLDKWIDYLCDDNNNYPMWFRSYVFKGVVKIGNYYPLIGEFTKRSSSTTDPFIEVEEDVISKIYGVVSKYVNQEMMTNDEERLIKRGLDFKSLYSNLYPKKSLRSDREDFSSIGLK